MIVATATKDFSHIFSLMNLKVCYLAILIKLFRQIQSGAIINLTLLGLKRLLMNLTTQN